METKKFTVIVSIVTMLVCILTVVYNFASMPAYGDTVVSAEPIYANNQNTATSSQSQSESKVSSTSSFASSKESSSTKEKTSSALKDTKNKSSSKVSSAKASASFPVNINTASKEELCTVPYIGETRAAAIIDYRTAHGAFKSVADLDGVKGFGTATIEKISNYITVG